MIGVSPFSREHAAGVVSLILPIQREEFGIPITIEGQPDLGNIAGFYQQAAGNFWVATEGDSIVGTVALLDIGSGDVALRKMFVAKEFRGAAHGVARRLLQVAFAWCSEQSVQCVYLGTTAKFLAAHRFYEKNGFREIQRTELPSNFPVMTVDSKFYCKRV
jgi:N-acetylglutamate synthase-like GNAT family acetyltransferase